MLLLGSRTVVAHMADEPREPRRLVGRGVFCMFLCLVFQYTRCHA